MKPKNLNLLLQIFFSVQLVLLSSCQEAIPVPSDETTVIVPPDSGMATPDEISSVIFANSLVVTNPAAVEAVSGVLGFNVLLSNFAREAGGEVANLGNSWVKLMANPQTLNNDTTDARTAAAEALELALQDIPARIQLIAVANRMDLAKINPASHAVETLGELHMVYELRDAKGLPVPYTVVMEFSVPASGTGNTSQEEDLKTWAKRWGDLSRLGLETPAYREQLLAILGEIATTGNFLQMRTNEKIDSSSKWEFRQFSVEDGVFAVNVLPQTPSERYKETANQQFLNTYISNNSADFLSGNHDFSRTPEGAAMLGIRSMSGSTWSQNSTPSDPYFIFYANTCSGCHNEVNRGGDRHIFTNNAARTELSAFLTDEIPITAKLSQNCVPPGTFSWCVQSDQGNNEWRWNESLRRRSLLACFAAGFTSCRIAGNSLVEESTSAAGTVIRVDAKPSH